MNRVRTITTWAWVIVMGLTVADVLYHVAMALVFAPAPK